MVAGFPPGKRAQGDAYERRAEAYLCLQGLRLLCRNYQCRLGEIDLIMHQGDTLVFVEVRFRKSQQFGGALASVTAAKQGRIRRTASFYLQSRGLNEARQSCRFDLVACEGPEIHWIQNAF
ncbi:YraN family protein [Zobellella aerophila]|uniref:UPF0102 protein GCM10022394_27250 n=1 Tax=Zobellella aerophila TaxID=870480 RepID=A0ABP6W8B2_9GAMM